MQAEATPSTRRHVSSVAAALLLEAGVTKPPVPVFALARRVGICDVARRHIDSAALLQDLSGVAGRRRPWGVILKASHCRATQRFSLAHEIGHLLLQGATLPSGRRVLAYRGAPGSKRYAQNEARMESFAADLLMPAPWLAEAVASGVSRAEICRRFGVTRSELARRLRPQSRNGA